MSTTGFPGPLSVEGAKPALLAAVPYIGGRPAIVNENGDFAPSLFWGGIGIRDPRYMQRLGAGSLAAGGYPNQDCGWYMSMGGLEVVRYAPATASATAIAAAQAATNGTAMTLVTASAAGIVYTAAAISLPLPLGATIPAGSLAMGTVGEYIGGGSSGAFQFLDPTKALSRAVSVTCGGGATGGAVLVSGYDIYGAAMSELITAVTGTTVNGQKAFKYVTSAVPQFTDADTSYSIGTADIFGINIRVGSFPYLRAYWDATLITANTGFVAADSTDPATTTTNDTRGTYAVQSAADGVKPLVMFAMPSAVQMVASTVAAAVEALVGVAQA